MRGWLHTLLYDAVMMNRYCARLIHGWGGKLGTLKDTDKGKQLIAEMKRVKLDDARSLITKLISRGYDKKVPERCSDQDVFVSFESSVQLAEHIKNCHALLREASCKLEGMIEKLQLMLANFRSNLEIFIMNVPSKAKNDSSANDFDRLYERLNTINKSINDDIDDEYGCIDSDEEAQLYQELDCLMEAQERALAFKGDSKKFMANAFQKIFLRVQEMESSFELVRTQFKMPCTNMHRTEVMYPAV